MVVVGLYLGNDFGSDVLETNYDPAENDLELPYRLIQAAGQTRINVDRLATPFRQLAQYTYFGKLLVKVVGKTTLRSQLYSKGFEGPNAPNAIELEQGKTDLRNNRAVMSLKRLSVEVSSRGGSLYVLLIPQNFYFRDDNPHIHPALDEHLSEVRQGPNLLSQFLEVCAEYGLRCLNPIDSLSRGDYFPNDAHWNAAGHHKMGNFLVNALP